jgi:hypothetical protein
MFPGSIVPQAFKELIRITKPGKLKYTGCGKLLMTFGAPIAKSHLPKTVQEPLEHPVY